MVYSASQAGSAKAAIDVEKWLLEEKIKQEAAAEAGPSKPSTSSRSSLGKRQLVVLSDDSESEDDFEIIKAPRVPLASSSRPNLGARPSIDRGDPAWVKERDAKQLKRHGTLNPRQQGPVRRNEVDMDKAIQHAPVIASTEPTLSAQQAGILDRIMEGQSFFFTGSAGTGKSVLFRAIVKAFKKRRDALPKEVREGAIPWELAITASTGMAAINVGGSTLHAWAGIGLGDEPKEVLAGKIRKFTQARKRWEETSALIIDEISMIHGTLFDKLDFIGQSIRRNREPFGGIQLILSGDFHQLPPVSKYGEPPALFAFESQAWKNTIRRHNTACLKEVFRQKDVEFVRLLEEMRKGRVSRADERKIQALCRPLNFDDGIPAVELYPLKEQVERLNMSKLNALKTESRTYVSADVPGTLPNGDRTPGWQMTKVLDDTKLVPELVLKVGAVVMLLANYTDMGLCNGSIGKVVDMMTIEDAAKEHIPALAESPSSYSIFPVVEFIPGKYVAVPTPKRVIVPCFEVEVKNPDGTIKAKRIQIPLLLAWGMTIHKAQGSSLERVKVELNRTFAPGQAYVAISRATSLEGLQVMNFNESSVRVDYRVIEWSESVEGDV